jgi:spermidine synthase
VEISQGVVAGARHFSGENFDVLNDPRAVIIVDDVVDFLETATEQYDIISADEKTAGKYASNSFSYSKEYYALLRRRLAPGGLVIQWMPTDLPPSQYALAVRTFLDQFPHVQLWYFPPVASFTMTNTFLVGSNERIDIDPLWMHQVMESDLGSFQGIRKYGLTTAEAVLAHFVGTEDTLRRTIPLGPINTFENPYYEFYSPSDYAVPPDERTLLNHEMLMSARGADFGRLVMKGARSPDANRLDAAFQAEGIFLRGHDAQLRGLPASEVMQYFDRAIGMAPLNWNLRNEVCSYLSSEFRWHYYRGEYDEATAFIRRSAEIYPESREAHETYGMMLWKINQPDLAIEELQRALSVNPRAVSARRTLASMYASRGQVEKGMEQWKNALVLDPEDVTTLVGYGIFLIQRGSITEAVQYLRKAYQLDSEDPEVIDGYSRAEYLSGNIPEARRIVLKGRQYYKGHPSFEEHRAAILGESK